MCKECDFAEKLMGYRYPCPKTGQWAFTHKMLITIGTKFLMNGEWAKHVRRWGKKFTSGIRRQESRKILREELKTT